MVIHRYTCQNLGVTVFLCSTVIIFWYAVLSLVMAATSGSAGNIDVSEWEGIRKANVPGFFAQDLEGTDPDSFDWIESNFGLLDTFHVAGVEEMLGKESKWERFERAIRKLNDDAPEGTAYKVLYLARHGQGYHNVAESFYGTPMWDCYWSLLNGDSTSKWLDAELTGVGIAEAQKANIAWKDQIKVNVPMPETYYASPLSRAASTLEITWKDISLDKPRIPKPVFRENLRETLGIHTCDRRSSKSTVAAKFSDFIFEDGFAEDDQLWKPDLREPNDARNIRLGKALDEIFASDDSTFISITAHSGAITSVLEVIGHREFRLQTGGMIPVVVKVEFLPHAEPAPTGLSPSLRPPKCTGSTDREGL